MPPTESNRAVLEKMAYRVLEATRDQTQWTAGGKFIADPKTHEDKVYNMKVEVWRRMTSLSCLKPIMHYKRCVDKGTRDCERANDLMDVCLRLSQLKFDIYAPKTPFILGPLPGCRDEYDNLNYTINANGHIDENLFNEFRSCITGEFSPGSTSFYPLPNIKSENKFDPFPERTHAMNH